MSDNEKIMVIPSSITSYFFFIFLLSFSNKKIFRALHKKSLLTSHGKKGDRNKEQGSIKLYDQFLVISETFRSAGCTAGSGRKSPVLKYRQVSWLKNISCRFAFPDHPVLLLTGRILSSDIMN
jgi:hypothetical protein